MIGVFGLLIGLAELGLIFQILQVDRRALKLQEELKGSVTAMADTRRKYYAGKLKTIAKQAQALADEAAHEADGVVSQEVKE